ncbi:hypothetical protein PTTG_29201 [Puccinia triticina 1-1 BBBD Race 1]|uniref:ATP-dependent DNA helicase sgs1 n=1 Tax=Puccinia triticina (isolate 1-1 / race 1 (BBBD)) TaxID=630390 RepID=A0A180G7X2_PUCT1|nr:hypothetical protein PTTG_29201 [Puccinia triticina 1-1 BBBD Race 1]
MVDTQINPPSGGDNQRDTLPSTSPADAISSTADPLPFENVSKNHTKELSLGRSGQVLKNKFQLTLNKNITNMTQGQQVEMLEKQSAKVYGPQAPKQVQLESVINLIHRCNTFVLAGTGVGKSWITKMYWDLCPKYRRPIVLVLNPLDSLGDNQISASIK